MDNANEPIRCYENTTPQFERLITAAKLVQKFVPAIKTARVENIYFDHGQNWKYSGIVVTEQNGSSYQIFNPNQYKRIISGNYDELIEAVDEKIRDLLRRTEPDTTEHDFSTAAPHIVSRDELKACKLDGQNADAKYAPIFELIAVGVSRVRDQDNSLKNVEYNESVGFYHDADDAVNAAVSNMTDINECGAYRYVIVKAREPGMCTCSMGGFDRMTFEYDRASDTYVQVPEPWYFENLGF